MEAAVLELVDPHSSLWMVGMLFSMPVANMKKGLFIRGLLVSDANCVGRKAAVPISA